MMKTIGGLMATLTNAIVIMQSPDETEAVKDFIAIAIIYEIDNILAATLYASSNGDKKIYVRAETD